MKKIKNIAFITGVKMKYLLLLLTLTQSAVAAPINQDLIGKWSNIKGGEYFNLDAGEEIIVITASAMKFYRNPADKPYAIIERYSIDPKFDGNGMPGYFITMSVRSMENPWDTASEHTSKIQVKDNFLIMDNYPGPENDYDERGMQWFTRVN